jgi:hypothetical protein
LPEPVMVKRGFASGAMEETKVNWTVSPASN